MKSFVLVFKGTDKIIQIEEGLFYGQPSPAHDIPLITREQMNNYLSNPYFNRNILNGTCEIKEITISFGEVVLLKEKVQPVDKKWEI